MNRACPPGDGTGAPTSPPPHRRGSRPTRSRAAALGLACAIAMGSLGPVVSYASGPVREAVARPLRAAQEAIKAQRWPEALAALDDAERTPARTPDEQLLIDRLRAVAAERAGDAPTAVRALASALESPRLPDADRLPTLAALASLSMQAKAFGQAQRWATRYRESGGDDPAVTDLLVRAAFLAGDLRTAASAGSALAERNEKDGRPPSEDVLRIVAKACLDLKDDACLDRTLERLLRHHPKPEYWIDRIDRLTGTRGFPSRLKLDALRLLLAADALSEADEFVEASELALKAGFPAEARRILSKGLESRVLGSADHRSRLARASRLADEDDAQAADAIARARAARDGEPLFAAGYGLATTGGVERGVTLMQEALARGTLRRPAEARLRLGETLARAGRTDEATQQFQAIQGDEAEAVLARLWQLWARRGRP